jgi:hypothetical protein
MLTRALVVWCAILAVAFVNGAVRELWLLARAGMMAGQILSSVLLCLAILAVSAMAAAWMAIPSAADAWKVGGLWLALTVGFEFGAGHFVFGQPWHALLEDYQGVGAFIRVPMLLTTVVAPFVAAWLRGAIHVPA